MLWLERLKSLSATRKERHHNLNRSRGGGDEKTNIVVLSVRGHASYHSIFGFKTLLESACELKKWHECQGKYENDWTKTDLFRTAYRFIFGERNFLEAAEFLEELDRKTKNNGAQFFSVSKGHYNHKNGWRVTTLRIKKNTGRMK